MVHPARRVPRERRGSDPESDARASNGKEVRRRDDGRGYVPDSFGHVAQLPQILRGFGLDAFVFTRGVGDEGERLKTEFLWKAPDESSVLAVHLIVGYGSSLSALPTDPQEALSFIQPFKELLQSKAANNNVLVMNGGITRSHNKGCQKRLSGSTSSLTTGYWCKAPFRTTYRGQRSPSKPRPIPGRT